METEILYYYTDSYVSGLLKTGSTVKSGVELNVIKLTDDEAKKLVEILDNNISELQHKCLSVYRDAFTLGENTYNICLSCGDFYKNNEKYFLSSKGVDAIKDFKSNLTKIL